MIYVPREYQRLIQNFAFDIPRTNIWARMGAGKTPASLHVADSCLKFGDANRVLILGPKRVAQSTWLEEQAKFRESFGHLSLAAAVGNIEQRKAAVMSRPRVMTINYESLQWLIDGYGDDWPFDMIIADESHCLKGLRIGVRTSVKGNEFLQGQGSKRSHALAKISFKRVRRWMNLNGTPAPNGIIDLWGQNFFIDGGRALGRSFTDFHQRFFRSYRSETGYTNYEPLSGAQAEIQNLMRPFTITIDPRDYFPVKDVIEQNVMIDLPPKARKAYDEMQKELFTILNHGTPDQVIVEVYNPGGKMQKCLQLANGFAFYDTEFKLWKETHDEKIEALRSIRNEQFGEPMLIRYCYTPDRERILKAFPDFKHIGSDPQIIRDFQAGKLAGLVVHAKSAGHGLSLHQNCRVLVDFSSDFNHGEDEQILERIGPTRQAQGGFDRNVFRYRLIARNTIEQHSVLPSLLYKLTVEQSLMNAMKRRGD